MKFKIFTLLFLSLTGLAFSYTALNLHPIPNAQAEDEVWTQHSGEGKWGTAAIWDTATLSEDNVWIVGANGHVWNWNGESWIRHSGTGRWGSSVMRNINAISENDVWISGASGHVWSYDGENWTQHSGTGRWGTTLIWNMQLINSNLLWISGASGHVWSYDGENWTQHSGEGKWGTATLVGLHALSQNNVWIGGTAGNVWSYDGENWTQHSGSGRWGSNDIYATYYGSDDNIWISGANGHVWNWNGENWTQHSGSGRWSTRIIRSILILSENDVWIAGDRGNTWNYDGENWTQHSGSGRWETENIYRIKYNNTPNTTLWINGSEGNVWSLFINTDDIAPDISEIASIPATTSAVITWQTDESASSTIEYGFNENYGMSQNNPELNTDHEEELINLLPCTTYSYRILAKDESDNESASDNSTFTTRGCAGNSEVVAQKTETINKESGGEVELLDNSKGIRLNLQPNFHNEAVVLQVKNIEKQEVLSSTSKPIKTNLVSNYIYDIKPLSESGSYISSLDETVDITIYFDEEELGDIDMATLAIYRWDGADWDKLDNCIIDDNNFSITCQTANFSTFGLFGESIAPTINQTQNNPVSFFASPSPSCKNIVSNAKPNLFQIDATDSKATLYFTPINNMNDKYAIVYGYESDVENHGIMFDYGKSSGAISYTINALAPNTTYFFKVRGQNGCMPGAWSEEVKITTTTSGVKIFTP